MENGGPPVSIRTSWSCYIDEVGNHRGTWQISREIGLDVWGRQHHAPQGLHYPQAEMMQCSHFVAATQTTRKGPHAQTDARNLCCACYLDSKHGCWLRSEQK